MIETHSGKLINPINPDPNSIDLHDIVTSLSRSCRFGGHTSRTYTVLEHSINCCLEGRARGFDKQTQKMLLMHDASEAYLSDIVTPVKIHLKEYYKIEEVLQNAIYTKYSAFGNASQMKEVDYDIAVYEARQLMPCGAKDSRWDPPKNNAPNAIVQYRLLKSQSETQRDDFFELAKDLGVVN
jgi:hypothetical protein